MTMIRRGNLFAISGEPSAVERFEDLAAGTDFRLERILSTGQATPAGEWYDQPLDEWVVLLTGTATLRIDDPPETIDLAPGDWVFLPAHCRHRVECTANGTPTLWLALHGEITLGEP